MKYQVLKTFNGDRPFTIGEEIDVPPNRRVEKLVELRYLQPLEMAPAKLAQTPSPVSAPAASPAPEVSPVVKKRAGRPKGAKNRPKTESKE